jgi:hypothetical protein
MAFAFKRRSAESVEARANQQGGNFEGFVLDEYKTFVPKNGDNAVRILPRDASEGADHYGEDVWVHYNIGPDKATIICPQKMANESCPVCEQRQRAERRGDEEAVKELRVVRRVLAWVIDKKNEDNGPLIWGMPWTVDRDIAKACRDRETGAFYFIDDPEEGYDVYFDRSGNPPQIDYTAFQLARRPTSVDPRILDFISTHPLLGTLRIRDYAEIQRLFSGGGDNGGAPTSVVPVDRPPPSPPQVSGAAERLPPWESPAVERLPPQVSSQSSFAAELERGRPPLRRDREPPAPADRPPPPPPPTPAREPEPALAAGAPAVVMSVADRTAQLRARFASKK